MIDYYVELVGFGVCSLVIILSGTQLAYYGDKIAELSGLGRMWVGLILMAAVTSLPELMTGISSVAIIDTPNLAAGDVFGSCVFNLLILSIIDFRIKKPITSLIKSDHLFAGLFGIILITISGVGILLGTALPSILWISPISILLIAVYIIAIKSIFKFEKQSVKEQIVETRLDSIKKAELKKAIKVYALNALLVLSAASFLPYFGEHIASKSNMNNTFFGTLFLAASTSLPELVVSLAAIRIKAFDIAVGNLLGSNIFNLLILAIDDVFYFKGSLFTIIEKDHLLSVLFIVIMTTVVGISLLIKPSRKIWYFSLDTLTILILYLCLMLILYFNIHSIV